MATSDNVVRAGLTPKLRDTEVLCNSLTYTQVIAFACSWFYLFIAARWRQAVRGASQEQLMCRRRPATSAMSYMHQRQPQFCSAIGRSMGLCVSRAGCVTCTSCWWGRPGVMLGSRRQQIEA
jgi:hypothetical protein